MGEGALDRVIAEIERAPRHSWPMLQRRLRELFERGPAPSPASGEFRGWLLLVTMRGPLGDLARRWTRAWMPWKGKRFDAPSGLGDNRFSNDVRWLVSLMWPFYRRLRPADGGHFRAFTFVTRIAPSVVNPSQTVLRIDYDLDENPRRIRDVVDEVVEIGPGELLGEAQVRRGGRWRTAAYFALRSAERATSSP